MAVAIFDPHVDWRAAETSAANDTARCDAEEVEFVQVQVVEIVWYGVFVGFWFLGWLRRVRRPFVGGKLPDVAGHIVEAVGIGRVTTDGRSCVELARGIVGARRIGGSVTPRKKTI